MAVTQIPAPRIRGVVSSVPSRRFENLTDSTGFPQEDVAKVVRMAGVKTRYLADDSCCSSDLCHAAAQRLLDRLDWAPETIDALVMITQSPDYPIPSTACLLHRTLRLKDHCATFDLGLGCSGYPYGIWLASMMLSSNGFRRVLVLHGETPSRFSRGADRSVALLFGDAGSATALEAPDPGQTFKPWWFSLHTDGTGWRDLIIEGGGFRNRFPEDRNQCFVEMNGPAIFNFTIKRVPPLVESTLKAAGRTVADVDYFVFHQSNLFIMRHLSKKLKLPDSKLPLTIGEYGSTGGPSIPLTLTQGGLKRMEERPLSVMLVGYGVGLSWASALLELPSDAVLDHVILPPASNPSD